MTIEVTISQRCGGEHGQPVYFAADCTATFSLDGNADNAQLMAGGAVSSQIKAHRGDTLLVAVKVNGELRARWVGVANQNAADAFDSFLNGRMRDWAYEARHIVRRNENDRRRAAKREADFYKLTTSSRREFPCTEA